MGEINYGSTPSGGFQASIPGLDGYGLGGGAGGMDWISSLARRSAQNKLKMQELALERARGEQSDFERRHQGRAGTEGYLDQLRKSAEIAKLKAEMGPVPVKETNVMGSTGGFLSPDEKAMNAYQRQLFLPQDAGMAGPSMQENADTSREKDDEWWARMKWGSSNWANNSDPFAPVPRSSSPQGSGERQDKYAWPNTSK